MLQIWLVLNLFITLPGGSAVAYLAHYEDKEFGWFSNYSLLFQEDQRSLIWRTVRIKINSIELSLAMTMAYVAPPENTKYCWWKEILADSLICFWIDYFVLIVFCRLSNLGFPKCIISLLHWMSGKGLNQRKETTAFNPFIKEFSFASADLNTWLLPETGSDFWFDWNSLLA